MLKCCPDAYQERTQNKGADVLTVLLNSHGITFILELSDSIVAAGLIVEFVG